MEQEIFQVQITLKRSKPRIWRRIQIPCILLLSDFHKVIQTCMGWENAHLHQFIKNGKFYTVKLQDDDFWNEFNNVDYKSLNVTEILKHEKDEVIYEYDFGDGWEHIIKLEKIIPHKGIFYPTCLAGKMNCPPEDCGGIWGFLNLVDILKQPDHPEYEEYLEWLGGEYDPEYFNVDEVNLRLKGKDYGCYDIDF